MAEEAALVFALVAIWHLPHIRGARWYELYLKYYHAPQSKRHGCCRRVPNLRKGLIIDIWSILYAFALIGILYYFLGNCQFDIFKTFVEDDEPKHPNALRGEIVLGLSALDNFLIRGWRKFFFTWKSPALGTIVATVALVCSGGILWAMGTTKLCLRDDFTNRFWMCFALWLIYSLWWIVIWFVSVIWWKSEGPKIYKGHAAKVQSKNHDYDRKKVKYFDLENRHWMDKYELLLTEYQQSNADYNNQNAHSRSQTQAQAQAQSQPYHHTEIIAPQSSDSSYISPRNDIHFFTNPNNNYHPSPPSSINRVEEYPYTQNSHYRSGMPY